MKSIRKSFIGRSYGRLAISIAVLLLAFALIASRTHAQTNTSYGTGALASNTTGLYNTANGYLALNHNTTAYSNTGIGANALFENTTGRFNTAIGVSALVYNQTGDGNTATGMNALRSNTTASNNTANGYVALYANTTGTQNTATGAWTLRHNNGSFNTATGFSALNFNTTGNYNTANGGQALYNNTTGNQNTASGVNALFSNTTGFYNTASGVGALFRNTTGRYNTAHGVNALYYNTTGSSNIALGLAAGSDHTTGSNNIDIGHRGVAGQANTIRLGTQGVQNATYVAGIRGATVPGGVSVFVDANGRLGTVTSSQRFKEQIKPMGQASESLLSLRPVTFRYKQELDAEGIPQFGLVAEEVEKVNPDLVVRDETGEVYSVRYEAVNAMLLNEFLKQHRKVDELEAKITALTASLKDQEMRLEKVSDQVAESRSVSPLVANNQ